MNQVNDYVFICFVCSPGKTSAALSLSLAMTGVITPVILLFLIRLKLWPNILQRLNIDPKHFIYLSQHFESPFKNLVGNAYHVRQACHELGQQWVHGIRQCEKYFPSS
jgi:hypothetical protein